MKLNSLICAVALATVAILIPVMSRAGATNSVAETKPTPYPLDHCVVSGEKFGGDMGKPIEFIYKTNGINQEIKFCCPMCKPQFVKDPDKYMKEIKDAEVKNTKN
jgi:hypothetical protein